MQVVCYEDPDGSMPEKVVFCRFKLIRATFYHTIKQYGKQDYKTELECVKQQV